MAGKKKDRTGRGNAYSAVELDELLSLVEARLPMGAGI